MGEQQFYKIEKAGGVCRLTFDRPKHNVFNIDMMNAMNAELDGLIADEDLKCLVLLGEGRSWCAGVEVGDHKPEMVDEMIAVFNGLLERLHRLEIPTIAAVHGACLGGGMEAAIACDIVVAGNSATFGQPEIKLGFFPPYAAIRLPELVGPAKAVEICTTGRIYSAEEARAMGFVGHVAEDDKLGEAVEKIVKNIKHSSPLIIRLNKRAVKKHLGLNFEDAMAGVSDLFLNTLMKTEDTLEGIKSFEEKRRPEWKNR